MEVTKNDRQNKKIKNSMDQEMVNEQSTKTETVQ